MSENIQHDEILHKLIQNSPLMGAPVELREAPNSISNTTNSPGWTQIVDHHPVDRGYYIVYAPAKGKAPAQVTSAFYSKKTKCFCLREKYCTRCVALDVLSSSTCVETQQALYSRTSSWKASPADTSVDENTFY